MNAAAAAGIRRLLERRWPLILIFALWAVGGGWLAVHRLFQVDEIQTMHMAWLLGQPDAASYFNSASMYMIPLSLLSRCFSDPLSYLAAGRLLFLAIFGAACAILAAAVSDRRRARFFAALLLLGTTAILWDYGFEVRHDNIVILGLSVLIWMLFNVRPGKAAESLFISGVVGGFLFLSSYKSVVLWGPILAYLAVANAVGARRSILRTVASAAGGFLAAASLALLGHLLMGSLSLYLQSFRFFFRTMKGESIRFFDWPYAGQFVWNHPWIIILSLLFLISKAGPAIRRAFSGAAFRGDDRDAKRYMLLLLALVFMALNPTPFPYNYMYVAVLAFPAVFHLTLKAFQDAPAQRWILVAALLFLQIVPGAARTLRHFRHNNDNQRQIVAFANAYTGPEDCVFDGAGLVMYRKGPGKMWYLHSLSRHLYMAGEIQSVRDMLARSPCPVLVQSYKWEFMHPDDLVFIKSRYVPFHQVIWILGCGIFAEAPGEYPFEIFKDGWYSVSTRTGKRGASLRIDAAPVSARPVFLRQGKHVIDIQTPADRVFILWVKEDRSSPPAVPAVAPPVFVNWY